MYITFLVPFCASVKFLACLIVQMDGTYMFNLDGLISKLCSIAQEMGEEENVQNLRASGIQALSSMVIRMLLVIHVYCLMHF